MMTATTTMNGAGFYAEIATNVYINWGMVEFTCAPLFFFVTLYPRFRAYISISQIF